MELLIDSHAHLTDEAFADDVAGVVERAALSGIGHIVTVAETLEDAERALALADRHDMVVPTAGVHPHRADGWSPDAARRLPAMMETGRFVAIGETGLDHHYDFSSRENQRRAFEEQLAIAKAIRLPFVAHCRAADDDLLAMLRDQAPFPAGGVVHCFCGNADQARAILALDLHIGIGGMVTFKKMDALKRIVADVIPLDRLLVETDCPYLAPAPRRGQRNEPAYVRHVAEEIARIKAADPAVVAAQTRRNAAALFQLGPDIPRESMAYVLGNSLYLNLTNRCTNECVFCNRLGDCRLGPYDLRLEREPTVAELIAAIGDSPQSYDEVVFCGYGEPTWRVEAILWLGRWLKANGVKRIRLNTNGHGNEIHGRSIVAELAAVVDVVSVSLNASDADQYARLCRPTEPRFNFDAVCRFIAEAKGAFREVIASAVAHPDVDVEACRTLAEENLGVAFRRRGY